MPIPFARREFLAGMAAHDGRSGHVTAIRRKRFRCLRSASP